MATNTLKKFKICAKYMDEALTVVLKVDYSTPLEVMVYGQIVPVYPVFKEDFITVGDTSKQE